MLMIARVVAALTALIAVVNIGVGAMTDPDFLLPDVLLAGLLIVAALLPARREAAPALIAALAFALGVFGVALSVQWNDGERNWSLILLIAADLAGLVCAALALRPRGGTA